MSGSSIAAAAAAAIAAFAAGAKAEQAWRPFATGSDVGQFGAFASARSDAVNPGALAIRISKKADVVWSLDCQGTLKRAPARVALAIDVAHADKCSLDGEATTDGAGRITLQLLKR